jgi:hypothetical protein
MIITITQTTNRTVDISQGDLDKLMDTHNVPTIEGESTADRLWDVYGVNGELTAALLLVSEVTDEDSEIDEIEDED